MRAFLPLLLLAATSAACSPADDEHSAPDAVASSLPMVDSVLPMDVMLARFREGLERPERLTGGAAELDGLVAAIVAALEASDTTAFEGLTLDLPAFAWLYYPSTRIARPPYELPPGVAWLQLREGNRSGALRALRELGGRPLGYRGYACGETPVVEGENRVWAGCLVTVERHEGEPPAPLRLFASILERDGRFVVLSWANDF